MKKDHALLHLLLSWLRHVYPRADAREKRFCDELRQSLHVSHAGGRYQLTWRYEGSDLHAEAPDEDFVFYSRAASGEGGHPNQIRERNWHQAEKLLKGVAAQCGVSLSAGGGALAWPGQDAGPVSTRLGPGLLGASLLVVITAVVAGWATLFWAACAAALLMALQHCQKDSLLGKGLDGWSAVLVTAGACLPLTLGARPGGALLFCAGMLAATFMESSGPKGSRLVWAACGVLMATPLWTAGLPALTGAGFASAALVLLAWMIPGRLEKAQAWSFVLGAAAVLMVWALFGQIPSASPPLSAAWAVALWAMIILSILCFGCWWVLGQQFLVFPWVTFALTAAQAAALAIGGGNGEAAKSMTIFAGYILLSFWRLARAFAKTTAPAARL